MRQEYTTDLLPPKERLSFWREAVCSTMVGVDCEVPDQTPFSGRFDFIADNGASIANLKATGHVASRSRPCINRSGDDFFMLFLQLSGRMGIVIGEREYDVRPGEFFFYDGREPHKQVFASSFEHIALRLPRTLVHRRWRPLGSAGCFLLPPSEPLSCVARAALRATAADVDELSRGDLGVAVESVMDLFTAAASKVHGKGARATSSPVTVQFSRARAIIQSRLDQETLSADDIATAMGISRRGLNKLFEKQGIGVAEYIVVERLEQAARDISSVAQQTHSISEIAYRWGFRNLSHFSKRFRAHFGQSPTQFRRQ